MINNFYYSFFYFIFLVVQFYIYLTFCRANKINIIKDSYKRNNIVNSAGLIFNVNFIFFYIFLLINEDPLIQNLIPRPYAIVFVVFVFGIISYYDDLKKLDLRIRIVAQFILIFLSLSTIQIPYEILNIIPLKILQLIIIISWVYIINCHNFLDGADGMLSINMIFMSAIIIADSFFSGKILVSTKLCSFILLSNLSFIFFNFPKASLFLGDTGSVFFGYLAGFIFFENIIYQNYFLAFTFILDIFSDVTITIIKKTINGHKPWDRLFDYKFLIPIVKYKLPHTSVTIPFLIFNLILFLIFIIFKVTDNNFLFILNIIATSLLLKYYSYEQK